MPLGVKSAGLGPGRAGFCVDFASLCEHHLLPFHGRMYVVCLSGGGGASAPVLPAATGVEVRAAVWRFSHRLQLQERLTVCAAPWQYAPFSAGFMCRSTQT